MTKPVQVLVKFKAQMNVAALESFRSESSTRNVGLLKACPRVYVEELAPGVEPRRGPQGHPGVLRRWSTPS